MPVIEESYGEHTGIGRIVQDFGLCDLTGAYVYTAKLRPKGLLVVVFFTAGSAGSLDALKAVKSWTSEIPTQKWSAIAVTDGDRNGIKSFVETHDLTGPTFVLDYEYYQSRRWGVSNLPSTYLVAGRTGRVLAKAIGFDESAMNAIKSRLKTEIDSLVAAEEAVKKAEEAKKAAEAAAKEEEAKKAAQSPAAKP